MAGEQITYAQLDQVLHQLGFTSRKVEPRWQRYEHAATQTLIVVGDRKPTEPVLPSELVSARRHIIENGLATAEELEQLFSPLSPRPKTTSGKKGAR